jgi:VIT1/CCC1 family predicted Fe2+/Mn2+ transporter
MPSLPPAFAEHVRREHGVGRAAEFLREIVYGGNDGIVTTFAIVAGFAGAGAEGAAKVGGVAVLLFGLANLFADATSMALGAYLSGRSEQDMHRRLRAGERRAVEEDPEGERAETLTILEAQGLSRADAKAMADILARNPEMHADFMMQNEFGMADPSDSSPARNGLATFLAFLVFGAIPLLPYMLWPPAPETLRLSVGATAAALGLLGLLRWRVTDETLGRCLGETMLVGGVCAVVAFGVGLAFR